MLLILFFLSFTPRVYAELNLKPEEAKQVGMKIWYNECGGSIEGLTSWNDGEEFASLGIGHFIWYPAGKKGFFKQTFPDLLAYLKKHKITLPKWLEQACIKGCPWPNRELFLKNQQSDQMKELRALLAKTIDLQVKFIIQNLNNMITHLPKYIKHEQLVHIKKQFQRVAQAPNGYYALIDYCNFKGHGLNGNERYAGYGWGLIHVLQHMQGSRPGKDALEDFSNAAKTVLEQRVAHAPNNRNESRWLPGWYNRLATYVQ